jgi:putative two-component system response regulator
MVKNPIILIVDDEDRNLRLIEALLLPMGYDVLKAANGKEATQMAMETSPDVILMDIMMPVMDGLEAVKILKQDAETRIIPVVMITALREVNDRIKALEAGADDFLSKPVDKTELRIRVQTLVKVKAYNDHLRNYQKQLEAEVARKTIQLRKTLEALQIASLDSIHRLSRAAEYKDEDTGAHIERMSHYSEAVARKMGLDGKTVERILYAAPMHDVGKIGIPDKILLKPGKLDPDEWEIMKQHATIGARILGGSRTGFIKLAEVIALTHHERWDGSGYPQGLRGTRIPIVGRITAIADVFDALTTRRPYKEPFSLEKSFAIIRESKGTHFDPDVVDAFFAVQDEILAIKETYQG